MSAYGTANDSEIGPEIYPSRTGTPSRPLPTSTTGIRRTERTTTMSKRFDTYEEAYYHASSRTRELKIAHGIERAIEFGRLGFNVSMLPQPGNRYGWELRCEAVEVGSPVLYGPPK